MNEAEDQIASSSTWREEGVHLHETLSNPWYRTVAELQNTLFEASVSFWSRRRGRAVFLPVTTSSVSSPMGLGSDSAPVQVELFGIDTYLADSMQFMLELGCRLVEADCYYVMPSFRGEGSDATHLSQFFHSEAEIVGDLDGVIDAAEGYLAHLARALIDQCLSGIERAGGKLTRLDALAQGGEFRRVTFDEAAHLVGDHGLSAGEGWRALTRQGERIMMSKVGEFTWVTDWDHLAVPFYQAFADDNRRTARNADLLFGVGEVVGAGMRHVEAGDVREALALHGVSDEPYRWYWEMRERQPLATSGFGMGIERFLAWVLDHDDIRDLQLIPRDNGKVFIP